jgi:glyoxylase-like metal-dependent hydrolase (beta-lactamase superfamily II)
MFRKLSESLYSYSDTCNVYVLKDGSRAILIDLGAGSVLDHLGEIGVSSVDWILHTHHHRDQCQGDPIANARGIPIAVPAHERPYFDEVEVFWGSRQIYNVYDVRQTFFTLAESVTVTRALVDYETFAWGPYKLFVQPTPGHSLGHIALVGDVDGHRVAFTGDLIAAPGRIRALYDLQYNYGAEDGCDHLVYSLGKLRAHGADMACPSHGEPFGDVSAATESLEGTLRRYMAHHWNVTVPSADVAPYAVLPHLVHIPGCSNTWIVVSDSGNALFVDYGSQNGALFHSNQVYFEAGNRLRMLEHNLDRLREQFGVRKIDVAMPSHYHDDHINGLPYLQHHHGTRVWCYKNMTDILQHPHGYKLGCVYAEPVVVERAIEQGETFRWEEFEFQVFHAPGHADYHMAMFGQIDGRQVAFSGDEIGMWGDGSIASNNIWRNHVHANSHEITGRLFLERQPEITCPGHGGPFRLDAERWRGFHAWCLTEQRFWSELAAGSNVEEAIYPDYVFLYPYQPPCAPGESVEMQVWYENITDHESTLDFRLVLPAGWAADPDRGTITVTPGEKGTLPFRLSVPAEQTTAYRRRAIALDVAIDGVSRGQLAEAVVDLRPEADWSRLQTG